MKEQTKKHMIALSVRIGTVFLLTIGIVVFTSYYVLSENFHKLLTEYSITLIQSMLSQGVQTVEYELAAGQKEAALLAHYFDAQECSFSEMEYDSDFVRMVYVSEDTTVASDGSRQEIRERSDIVAAFGGETAVHGPCFNDSNEFIVSYSAPVRQDGKITGVLCIEKDGYRFCDLIQEIKFIDTGEAYIINEEGTDIAVSDSSHIEWVTSEYNSQKLYEEKGDAVVQSIMELELKGLRGETGYGTYSWNDGLCYVVYEPIPSVGWVLLAGLREEEISAMTQSAFYGAISDSPTLIICFSLFLVLFVLIIVWMISSIKKSAAINEKLEIIANHDALTGLLNRRYLETELSRTWRYPVKVASEAAVLMIDIDNFKKYNDHYGHQKGDDCLRRVASTLNYACKEYNGNVMRYGGEEFIIVAFALDRERAQQLGNQVCTLVEAEKLPDSEGGVVTVSVGVCSVESTVDVSLYDCIMIADKALYQAKAEGKNRAVLWTRNE